MKLKYCLIIIYILHSVNVLAKFGSTCSLLVNGPSDNYLNTYTAYGHISGNIDMVENITDSCNKATQEIKFCLKMPSSSSNVCSNEIIIKVSESKTIGEIASGTLLGMDVLLKDIPLSVKNFANSLCLIMPTSRGEVSLGCKDTSTLPPHVDPTPIDPGCSNIGKSCHLGHIKSQSILNFSGMTVDCLQETLEQVFFNINGCTPKAGEDISPNLLTPFPLFLQTMKTIVQWFIVLYVIMFGVNISLAPNTFNRGLLFKFLLKVLLVTYFAVGFYSTSSSPDKINNGMLKYVVPILPVATAEFANIVLNAGGARGLCQFDSSRYPDGSKFYALWDAIDCRIGYYLGMGALYEDNPSIKQVSYEDFPAEKETNDNNIKNKSHKRVHTTVQALNDVLTMKIFTVLFGLLMSSSFAGIIAFIAGLIFAVVFMSIMLSFLTSYLGSLVTLYAMAYISPVFIPLALFNRTKAYFDAWLRIIVSSILQPAVRVGFIAILIYFYDNAIYKNCTFTRHDHDLSDIKYSTFEINLPTDNPDDCLHSAGYQLLHYYQGFGWTKSDLMFFSVNSINMVSGLLEGLIFAAVFSYIAYFFSQSLNKFVADLTSGPIMDAISASPVQLIGVAMQAAESIKNIATAASSGGGSPGGGGNLSGGAMGSDPTNEVSKASDGGGSVERKDPIDFGGGKDSSGKLSGDNLGK